MGNQKVKIQKDSDPGFTQFLESLLPVHSTKTQQVHPKPAHREHPAKHADKPGFSPPKSHEEELKRLGIKSLPGEAKIEAKPFHLAGYLEKVKAAHRPKEGPRLQATYNFYEEKYAQHIGRTPVKMEPGRVDSPAIPGIAKNKSFGSVQEALAAKIDCKVKLSLTEPILIGGKVTTLYDGMHADLQARESSKKFG